MKTMSCCGTDCSQCSYAGTNCPGCTASPGPSLLQSRHPVSHLPVRRLGKQTPKLRLMPGAALLHLARHPGPPADRRSICRRHPGTSGASQAEGPETKYICTPFGRPGYGAFQGLYRDLLGLEVQNDLGANVTLSCGLALQTLDSWKGLLKPVRSPDPPRRRAVFLRPRTWTSLRKRRKPCPSGLCIQSGSIPGASVPCAFTTPTGTSSRSASPCPPWSAASSPKASPWKRPPAAWTFRWNTSPPFRAGKRRSYTTRGHPKGLASRFVSYPVLQRAVLDFSRANQPSSSFLASAMIFAWLAWGTSS